jgi:hypothetical protein
MVSDLAMTKDDQRSGEFIMRSVSLKLACGVICWALLAPAVHAGEVTIGKSPDHASAEPRDAGWRAGCGWQSNHREQGSLPDRLPGR